MPFVYLKAEEIDYGTYVYVRHYTAEEAKKEFELFKQVYPTPEKGELVPVHWLEGWWTFRGVPDNHESLWQEFEPGTDFYQCSASHADLITRHLENLTANSLAKASTLDDHVDFEV